MRSLNDETWYEPFGTSLRMSDLGYSNQNQARINISLNSLDEYIRDLRRAITTPEPAYEEIGVKVDGEYRQLSASQLQIERGADSWKLTQIILDPNADRSWHMRFTVDLAASRF